MADLHFAIETLLALLLVIFAVALLARWLHLPYTIALVVAGFLGFQPGFREVHLTPDLILVVFLPLLLFEGAYNVSARNLWRNLIPIALLAIPGVVIGTAITAIIVHGLLKLSWALALLFGALIASTDPIAVVALFRELGAPKRLVLLVEGESLFNDGTAITLFQILLAVVVTGRFSVGGGVLQFFVTVVGALAIGVAIGYGGSLLLPRVDNSQLQIIVTVIAAYGSYLLAEHFSVSGAIAVVVTGLFFGNYGATRGVSPTAVFALSNTWEFLGFVANSLIFLLIGIELDPLTLIQNWWPIAAAFLAVLVARVGVVYLLLPFLRGEHRIPWQFRPVLVWGGLRGAVSLALVLSIPFTLAGGQAFPHRGILQIMAFGVVGVSLVLQGLTMRPLLSRLGLMQARATEGELAMVQARLHAGEGALFSLTQAHDNGDLSGLQYERLASAYTLEHEQLEQQLQQLQQAQSESA